MISALGSFTSRIDLLDGPAVGEVWGIQSWRAYKIEPGDRKLKWVSDPAIEFYLPTLQYFAELPFRILSATHVAYAGETGYRGRRYDVVFATWRAFAPNSKYDQYQVWISRDSGLMEIVHYTRREGAPSFAAGTMFYEDFRPVASILIPFKQTVTATRPEQSRHPLDENFFHQLRLQSARLLEKEPESLYPVPTIVNVDRIRELHRWFHGDFRLKLEDGQELTVSRRYRANLSDLAGRL
ncbi:MAG: LytTR family transcriptional regulator [Acidobacteria bacterium]|nr:LytTR family transcriptional regulator [Acidobacteriota bacterium]MCI0627407.1 LytTR family transcriptional regulator [Acidobacteriota bacterium]MCI0719381.1 LytTR family transcriptional regulator [Acidobacteriota bacterium]